MVVFENAVMLNEEICRYYELILNDVGTYLNDQNELKKAAEAEKRLTEWLRNTA